MNRKIKNIVLSGLLLFTCGTATVNAEEEYIEAKGSYIKDELGNIYPIESRLVDTQMNVSEGMLSQTYEYDIQLPSDDMMIHGDDAYPGISTDGITKPGYDSHGTMSSYLTINYSISNSKYLLYSVKPSWTFYDTSVSIVSRALYYACYGPGINQWTQVYPYSNVTYNTGYSVYVPDEYGYGLGATLELTLQAAGGSRWEVNIYNPLFNNIPDPIGGRW